MSRRLSPCKRRDFIRQLRNLGFEGPLAGGNHWYMVYGARRLPVPSCGEYTPAMFAELLREVEGLVGEPSVRRQRSARRLPRRGKG